MSGPRMPATTQLTPSLKFQIEQADEKIREGLRLEAAPLGPFYRMRFYNDVESVMLIGNTEQVRQIIRELQGAIGLGRDRKRKRRQERA